MSPRDGGNSAVWIRRERLVNKLRDLGYKLKQDAWRVTIFRHPVSMRVVSVPKRDLLSEEFVRSVLRQAGCDADDVKTFVCSNIN